MTALAMMATEVMASETATVNAASAEKKARDSTKWLHRTKLCVYSIQGTCRLGSKCSFAHAATEVQDAPNLYKTQLCDAFDKGKCSNVDCSFAHGQEELRLSPNFKNKLCKWASKGKCRNGSECGFAHGEDELRNAPPMDKISPPPSPPPPPPGLSLKIAEAPKMGRPVLDLKSSRTDENVPAPLNQQVEGMAATIAALQWKMEEMLLQTQVTGMKQHLGQLSAQCQALGHELGQTSNQLPTRTPLKTPLSSKATPFQPTFLTTKAQAFVPASDMYWASDDSTSLAAASDEGGLSSD